MCTAESSILSLESSKAGMKKSRAHCAILRCSRDGLEPRGTDGALQVPYSGTSACILVIDNLLYDASSCVSCGVDEQIESAADALIVSVCCERACNGVSSPCISNFCAITSLQCMLAVRYAARGSASTRTLSAWSRRHCKLPFAVAQVDGRVVEKCVVSASR